MNLKHLSYVRSATENIGFSQKWIKHQMETKHDDRIKEKNRATKRQIKRCFLFLWFWSNAVEMFAPWQPCIFANPSIFNLIFYFSPVPRIFSSLVTSAPPPVILSLLSNRGRSQWGSNFLLEYVWHHSDFLVVECVVRGALNAWLDKSLTNSPQAEFFIRSEPILVWNFNLAEFTESDN